MFTHMLWFNRILAVVGLVLIFNPEFILEVAGLLIMLVVLAINWTRHKRSLEAPPAATA
jgi:membrane protein implicated in regulation of membrane protease activity